MSNHRHYALIFCLALLTTGLYAQSPSSTWNPDKGKDYINPIIHADYSDPDVCRVGDDFYMTSSSFNCIPGLQILHSRDLVNWDIIGAALTDYPGPLWDDSRPWATPLQSDPGELGNNMWNSKVQHGNGVWAPAIRYHNGEFYIYCGDPDRGIFMVKTKDPRGTWDAPVWVVKAKGYIDPCPLWDDDGHAYLSHGCAGSRAGTKSVLFVAPMSADGTHLTGKSRIVYDGHITQPTIEGTKFYKRDGRYYIFSPAGGVPTGWQVALRSESPWGPYEERVVMAQGNSPVNGPHQGAWIETAAGEDWFIHFQDKDAYGRIVHLQPMRWIDGWPVIGVDEDGDGVGEPVMRYRKPRISASTESEAAKDAVQPAESDEFASADLGLQWQWHGVPSPYWYYCNAVDGSLRLYSVEQGENWKNLADTPNLLLQKVPAEKFSAVAKVRFIPNPQLKQKGENCGLIVMGNDYSGLRLTDTPEGVVLEEIVCSKALKGGSETVLGRVMLESKALDVPYSNKYMSTTVPPVAPLAYKAAEAYLKLQVTSRKRQGNVPEMVCTWHYSLDGRKWMQLSNKEFIAQPGKWIGAKMGFYCNRHHSKNDSGWLEIDWFRVSD